jgi:type I restriction enzyme M protein
MAAIERDNPSLKGVLPKDFARPASTSSASADHQPGERHRPRRVKQTAKDTLGRVYEYFLSRFASAEGKSGGQFYTPSHVVRVLVEMLAPYKGRVYDPCCGSGGMFVQSEKFIEAHGGKLGDISIYGQESNYTTWRLAKMNLAIRGIDAQIATATRSTTTAPRPQGRLCARQPAVQRQRLARRSAEGRQALGLRRAAGGQRQLRLGAALHPPPRADGLAGFVLANGSMSSNQSGEGEIRKASSKPTWWTAWWRCRASSSTRRRSRSASGSSPATRRTAASATDRGETLFIDARKLGTLVDRTHRELTDDDIAKIAGTYHAWRGDKGAGEYAQDVPGFCKSAKLEEIRKHGHVLTPGPLRRRRSRRGRRRAVRREDEAPHRDAARAAGRGREARRRDRRQPEGAWVCEWRRSGASFGWSVIRRWITGHSTQRYTSSISMGMTSGLPTTSSSSSTFRATIPEAHSHR